MLNNQNKNVFYIGILTACVSASAILGMIVPLYILSAFLAFRYGSIFPACFAFSLYLVVYASGSTFAHLPEIAFVCMLLVSLKIRNYTIFV